MRQLLWGEDPSAGYFVKVGEETDDEGLVAQQHVRLFELVGHQRLDSNVSFVFVVRTPGREDWDWMWEGQPLQNEPVALHPTAITALRPLGFGVDIAQPRWHKAFLTVALMPLRALRFVHPPVNRADLWLIGFRLDLFDDLLAEQGDLLLGFRYKA